MLTSRPCSQPRSCRATCRRSRPPAGSPSPTCCCRPGLYRHLPLPKQPARSAPPSVITGNLSEKDLCITRNGRLRVMNSRRPWASFGYAGSAGRCRRSARLQRSHRLPRRRRMIQHDVANKKNEARTALTAADRRQIQLAASARELEKILSLDTPERCVILTDTDGADHDGRDRPVCSVVNVRTTPAHATRAQRRAPRTRSCG